ncbi:PLASMODESMATA CALLOSE-BINDING PROTEIN 2 [Zea mays]|nr:PLASMODESMATA CALLOSE-BINDING PROTEIN 2 [Zea mays]AQK94752.1 PLASMODESMATA CALLOSE-BINDING PROTEIN 2 [Zea mays]AQK94758.1 PLASMODESMATA CALLOSE-BINDING PROTEIN 2 [Zea mays]AQK94759.1 PLASMODESMATA CALLOSE-BINDING PROTEIN 2 [Zea mays]
MSGVSACAYLMK